MRLNKIILTNYRQFRFIEIDFVKKLNEDIHIIVGKNGTGKTNLLNAINWCLYNEEPHLSQQSQKLPLLNLNSIQQSNDNQDINCCVEVRFTSENNSNISFLRNATFRTYQNDKNPKSQNVQFEARIIDNKGNTEILNEELADSLADRFVPNSIKEFFFFDGERLDNYFRKATAQNIRHAIFVISQIDLLENRLEYRLSEIQKEIRREAGSNNPHIEEKRNLLEDAKSQLSLFENNIIECQAEINMAEDELRELNKKLEAIPDLERYEKERFELKASRKHKKKFLDEKKSEYEDLIFEFSKIIMFWPAIKYSSELLKEKRIKNEIPPPASPQILHKSLETGTCIICGQPLDDKIRGKVSKFLDQMKISSSISSELSKMEIQILPFSERIYQFKKIFKKIDDEINSYNIDLEKIEKRINQIDKLQSGYNIKKINEWVEQRKKYENALAMNQQKKGVFIERENKLNEDMLTFEKQFQDEIKKEKKTKELSNQLNFCGSALNVIKATKIQIMNETRTKIQKETKKNFFKLIWKKETFKDISISEDFDINLTHIMGYPCLGSISAAERELLALSFTLALHSISGFDAPILIDTPVARVSDEHRANLGKIFLEVSALKQVILMFTPSEYSSDISEVLDKCSNNKFILKLSSDEKEVKLQEV